MKPQGGTSNLAHLSACVRFLLLIRITLRNVILAPASLRMCSQASAPTVYCDGRNGVDCFSAFALGGMICRQYLPRYRKAKWGCSNPAKGLMMMMMFIFCLVEGAVGTVRRRCLSRYRRAKWAALIMQTGLYTAKKI